MNMTKRIVATIVGFAMVVVMAPGVIFGQTENQTVEELQAQIAALQQQLAQLQAQLAALQGAPAAPAAVTCTFTRNLYPGITGDDVKCLQQYLNSAGFKLADTGPGSPGNETTFYGPLTQAAVKKWQDANGIAYGAWGGYFGPLSRAKYSELTAKKEKKEEEKKEEEKKEEEKKEEAVEGELSAAWELLPTGVKVKEGETKNVAAFKVKAKLSSIKVQRVDITMATTTPWKFLTNIALYDGANLIQEKTVSRDTLIEVKPGEVYTVRFTGAELFTVPKDGEKVITVQVTATSVFPSGAPDSITLKIPTNGIRGLDGAGIQQYVRDVSGEKSFELEAALPGALEISLNSGSPKERVAIVDQTPGVDTETELLIVDLKAKNKDLTLTKLSVNVDVTTTTDNGELKALNLYDGTTLLATKDVTSGEFDDLNVKITKDSTKSLTIKLVSAGTFTGDSVDVDVDATGTTAVDVDFDSATVTGTADGKPVHLYNVAPLVVLDSASATAADRNATSGKETGEFTIKFKVTALGGDVWISKSTADLALKVTRGTTDNETPDSGEISLTTTATAENWGYKVAKDTTETFTVSVTRNPISSGSGYWYLRITQINWDTDDNTATNPVTWTAAWAVDTLKTGEVFLDQD